MPHSAQVMRYTAGNAEGFGFPILILNISVLSPKQCFFTYLNGTPKLPTVLTFKHRHCQCQRDILQFTEHRHTHITCKDAQYSSFWLVKLWGLYGIFRSTRSFQNAAIRLITGTSRRDHITPVLRQLHWLPVRHRVEFKLAVSVFKALHGLARWYLADDCQLVTAAGRRQLRSSDAHPHVRHPTHTHSSWRSIIRSRWITSVELSTYLTS